MSLAPGTLIGPCAILGLLGAGGMGEVLRARDTRMAWIADVSDEGGQRHGWVRPPGRPGGRTCISSTGELAPMWASDGRPHHFVSGGWLNAAAASLQ
jgi:hypothetical protein